MKELNDSTFRWVEKVLEPGSIIENIKPLPGATSSSLYSIQTQIASYVLRLIDNKEWLQEEPDLAPHEAASLKYASQSHLPTPELVAFDKNGDYCGVPAVLMTRIPGKVDLKPDNLDLWLDWLAKSLSRIHILDGGDFSWHYFSYTDISNLEIPQWSSRPDLWKKAFQIVKGPKPKAPECFIHRDFHPANILWQNGRISGVVDWSNACRGPAWVDLGHCRMNLVMLYGIEAADRFLHTYLASTDDPFKYEQYFDLLSLCDFTLPGPPEVYKGWQAFGIHDLTDNMMRERTDEFLIRVMERGDYDGNPTI
ncbi:MAG TPA: aminoglycoside phosphotransferase family protein [Bacillales bacterium]